MPTPRARWAKVPSHDRRALAVALALALIGVIPLLGRDATAALQLGPVPRDHARCVRVVSTVTVGGLTATTHEYFQFTTRRGLVIHHDHDEPMPRSDFERRGTACALAAALAFLVLWKWVGFLAPILRRSATWPIVMVGLSLGSVVGMPPALLLSWIARQALRDHDPPAWFTGVVRLDSAVQFSLQGLVALVVVAWLLAGREPEPDATPPPAPP